MFIRLSWNGLFLNATCVKNGKFYIILMSFVLIIVFFRYVKKRSLFYHMKQHAGNQIVCMECGHLSASKDEYNVHILQHDKDRPWQCEKCNDRFSRRQQYLFHIKVHFNDLRY